MKQCQYVISAYFFFHNHGHVVIPVITIDNHYHAVIPAITLIMHCENFAPV